MLCLHPELHRYTSLSERRIRRNKNSRRVPSAGGALESAVPCKIQQPERKNKSKKMCQGVRINWCQAGADVPLIRGSISRTLDVSYAHAAEGMEIETRKIFHLHVPRILQTKKYLE